MAFDNIREKLFSAVSGKKLNKIEHPDEQSVNEKDLCNFVRDKVETIRANASRVSHEGVWLTNIAYLLGFDSIFYDTSLRHFRPIQYPGQFLRRHKIAINYILPTIQNRAARLTKSEPRYDVRPNSMSEEDKEAARLGLYIINQIWDAQKINQKRIDLVMWLQQCGHAYIKTCWDKTLGPWMPHQDKNGEMVLKPIGDIRIDVVSPFEVFPDPLAQTMDDVNYLVQAKIRPINYFMEQFPERGVFVRPEDVWLTSLEYESRINTFSNQSGSATGVNELVKNAAIELSYYEKPNYRHPNGRHLVCANGVLLKDDDLPIDEIPFTKFDDVKIGGKFYSESVITHMRSIQDQLNRTISQRSAWVNKMLTGKYMAARGHGLMAESLNDQSGEVVEYDPVPNAPPPTGMQTPSIPQYAYTEDDYLTRKLNDIAGINEASRGQMPSASIPAIGMQLLVEQDDTRIGVEVENHEHGYANIGRQILKYVSTYYELPRLLKISGKGMGYTVKSFQGADLKGNHDVIVIRGSTLPGSKVLKRQEIINLHQSGYLGDPQDPMVLENVLNMLEYGEISEVWKDHSLDMGQIKKQITMIEQGIEPPVSEFDNHALFIQELNRYRKSEKWDLLDDNSKMIMISCMQSHLEELTNLSAPDTSAEGLDQPGLQKQFGAQAAEEQLMAEMGPDDMLGDIPPDEGQML